MTNDADDGGSTTLSPDEAFSALGNETRIRILQTLGGADGPLSFTELRTRVGIRHGGQFNYHLERLVGHFVGETDDGYELRQTGKRVIQAILSGAVTEDPVLEPTRVDEPCPYCGARMMVTYRRERVEQYCPECAGHYDQESIGEYAAELGEYGYLGSLTLPPAGLRDRDAEEVAQVSWTWGLLELLAVASGICPRCSATLDQSTSVCETHEAVHERCDQCGNRHAVQLNARCTNCLYDRRGAVVLGLLSDIDLLAFLTAHGINPVSPTSTSAYDETVMGYEEEVLSVDPLEVQLKFATDENTLTLSIDEELDVTRVTKSWTADSH